MFAIYYLLLGVILVDSSKATIVAEKPCIQPETQYVELAEKIDTIAELFPLASQLKEFIIKFTKTLYEVITIYSYAYDILPKSLPFGCSFPLLLANLSEIYARTNCYFTSLAESTRFIQRILRNFKNIFNKFFNTLINVLVEILSKYEDNQSLNRTIVALKKLLGNDVTDL